jgi:hypothetical protein
MDINAVDIEALKRILHQAEEWMLQKGNKPHEEGAPEDAPSEEQPPSDDPGAVVEIDAKPEPKPQRDVLDVIDFGGSHMDPNEDGPPEPEPEPRPHRMPVAKRSRY